MKKMILPVLVLVLLSGLLLAFPASFGVAQTSASTFKISGYILDSNGHGIAGADIIFGVPQIVPSAHSDSNGHYEMFAPSGTYHVNVWPPFDSNYVDYDEPGFAVSSDVAKNITLQTGFKVSGYIADPFGTPARGATIILNNFGSGYFSTADGYYFLSVPAGTYTLYAHPRTGYNYSTPTTNFPAYYEYNVAVNGNMVKNITVNSIYKISGYILDSSGHGIGGANIIFGVPQTVPSVYSDNSGYYVIYAPAGTYHVDVWPPFDSNFIYYDEPGFTVRSDIAKTMILSSGYKVSGYVTDSSGAPVKGAVTSLDNFVVGWYSNDQGRYFVTAPAGTYKFSVQPKFGLTFPSYFENNFTVTSNLSKNVTLPTPTTLPSPTPSPTLPPGVTAPPTSSPSPTRQTSFITLSANTSSSSVGSTVIINGRLSDRNGNPLTGKTVIFAYAVGSSPVWSAVGSGDTNAAGEYNVQWVIEASGSFTLKAAWGGDTNYLASANTTTLTVLPYQNQQVFYVESNSTVTGLDFNSTSLTLGFTVSGPSGTTGYTRASVAKTLVANFTGISVYLDGKQLNCTVSSANDYWTVTFSYSHSTHQVAVNLFGDGETSAEPIPEFPSWLVLVSVMGAATAVFVLSRKKLLASPATS